MNDVVEQLGYSTVQHGEYNDRVFLMHLAHEDMPGIVQEMEKLAMERGYSKIFAKVPGRFRKKFLDAGYTVEAVIPGFYEDGDEVCMMARYFAPERQKIVDGEVIDRVLKKARGKKTAASPISLGPGYRIETASIDDAVEMAALYRRVFQTYPFPIFNPDYILRTMTNNCVYFAIREGESIIALSSAEMDRCRNAEMTDFATLPEYRGKSFARHLLLEMEREMRSRNIKLTYTIARSVSYGMNITFAKAGYRYGGTLINNTNISGKIESMNIWYRHLDE